MHRELPPNHPQQLVFGIQWVNAGITRHRVLYISSMVALHSLESNMLVNSAYIHSGSPFPVTLIMDKLFLCCLELHLPRKPLVKLFYLHIFMTAYDSLDEQ